MLDKEIFYPKQPSNHFRTPVNLYPKLKTKDQKKNNSNQFVYFEMKVQTRNFIFIYLQKSFDQRPRVGYYQLKQKLIKNVTSCFLILFRRKYFRKGIDKTKFSYYHHYSI